MHGENPGSNEMETSVAVVVDEVPEGAFQALQMTICDQRSVGVDGCIDTKKIHAEWVVDECLSEAHEDSFLLFSNLPASYSLKTSPDVVCSPSRFSNV